MSYQRNKYNNANGTNSGLISYKDKMQFRSLEDSEIQQMNICDTNQISWLDKNIHDSHQKANSIFFDYPSIVDSARKT